MDASDGAIPWRRDWDSEAKTKNEEVRERLKKVVRVCFLQNFTAPLCLASSGAKDCRCRQKRQTQYTHEC